MRKTLTAIAVAAAVSVAATADAKTLRWAFQGDAQGLDPYGLNETFTLGMLGNVYEGLIRHRPFHEHRARNRCEDGLQAVLRLVG